MDSWACVLEMSRTLDFAAATIGKLCVALYRY